MKKTFVLILLIFTLTGCIQNENFTETCKTENLSENITDKTKTKVTFNNKDEILKAVITKTYRSKNEKGQKTIEAIKESADTYNQKYAENKNIKIEISKNTEVEYQIKYHLNVQNLSDNALREFNLRKNSIRYFNLMKDKEIECQ